jgi:hypothetical protein
METYLPSQGVQTTLSTMNLNDANQRAAFDPPIPNPIIIAQPVNDEHDDDVAAYNAAAQLAPVAIANHLANGAVNALPLAIVVERNRRQHLPANPNHPRHNERLHALHLQLHRQIRRFRHWQLQGVPRREIQFNEGPIPERLFIGPLRREEDPDPVFGPPFLMPPPDAFHPLNPDISQVRLYYHRDIFMPFLPIWMRVIVNAVKTMSTIPYTCCGLEDRLDTNEYVLFRTYTGLDRSRYVNFFAVMGFDHARTVNVSKSMLDVLSRCGHYNVSDNIINTYHNHIQASFEGDSSLLNKEICANTCRFFAQCKMVEQYYDRFVTLPSVYQRA